MPFAMNRGALQAEKLKKLQQLQGYTRKSPIPRLGTRTLKGRLPRGDPGCWDLARMERATTKKAQKDKPVPTDGTALSRHAGQRKVTTTTVFGRIEELKQPKRLFAVQNSIVGPKTERKRGRLLRKLPAACSSSMK
jgi:hypothetical protein